MRIIQTNIAWEVTSVFMRELFSDWYKLEIILFEQELSRLNAQVKI